MKRIRTFDSIFMIAVSIVLLFLLGGCGTTYSVQQQLAPIASQKGVYVIASCETQDNRATKQTCDVLKNEVRYQLLKRGLYEKNINEAPREVNLTITYSKNASTWTRALWGPAAGKDGLDVTVEVRDRQSGNVVGRAKASHFNVTAGNYTELLMAKEVSYKIADFLASGKSK